MTETYVAPIVAQQYEVNRAKCLDQGGCPSAEQMGSLICQQTSACGADPVEAAKNLNDLVNLAAGGGGGFAGKRRRTLLQFEGLVDLVGEGGGGAFPEDAVEVDDALAEAASRAEPAWAVGTAAGGVASVEPAANSALSQRSSSATNGRHSRGRKT